MDDLRAADVDFLTIGQYLQPTRKHHPVVRFVPPDEFKAFETIAYAKGFLMVSASPLTRSSHHAGEDFARLRAARAASTAPEAPRNAELRHHATCPPCRDRHVRSRRRRRGLSAIPAALREPRRPLAPRGRRQGNPHRDDDGRLQVHPRVVHHARRRSTGRTFIIRADYIDGPFEHLENVWRFEPRGRGELLVHFTIDYEFRSRTLSLLIGRGVRPRLPQIRRRLRGARRCGLRRTSRSARAGAARSGPEGAVSLADAAPGRIGAAQIAARSLSIVSATRTLARRIEKRPRSSKT